MAVYTQLHFDEVEELIAPLQLGRLVAMQPVSAGIENTTYFIQLSGTAIESRAYEYVLTIAEELSTEDVGFIARLMIDFADGGLPVPAPRFAAAQAHQKSAQPGLGTIAAPLTVHGKPVLLTPKIRGVHPNDVVPLAELQELGQLLAKMHLVALEKNYQHESHRSLRWVQNTAARQIAHLTQDDRNLLLEELGLLETYVKPGRNLPRAVIHGDVFRDNVLVEHGHICAIIDFFSAGDGYLAFDLAVAVNDWCFDIAGGFLAQRYDALIQAYSAIRTPSAEERSCWNDILRIAALRFWVSRLNECHHGTTHAPKGRGKDPIAYRKLLLKHRQLTLSL